MILARLGRWLDDRLGASRSAFARSALRKIFPDHWSFMLGEIALYSFVVLVVTGVYLSLFFTASTREVVYEGTYEPLRGAEVSEAYASVVEISFDVRAGLLVRQIHHWAALVFVAAIVVHAARVFFTGAFRRPRELTWVIGVTLLALAIFNGFTGYSLPDDLLSGLGLRIAHSTLLSVPLVGPELAFLLFGGEFPSEDLIPRLYMLHILLVPVAIGLLIGLHLALVWHQHHTQFPRPGRSERNIVGDRLWPTYAAKTLALFFLVFAVLAALGGLVQINPVWIWGPFEPATATSPAQPDWFLGWVEGALRVFPAWEPELFGYLVPNPFFPGVLLPALTFALLYAWPFLEARVTGDREAHHLLDRPRDRPVRTGVGVAALVFYGLLLAAASNDLLARELGVPVLTVTWVFRILILLLPPVTGFVAFRLARGLVASGADGLLAAPVGTLVRGAERPRGEPREP